jgi:hypothetical protein
VPLRGVRPTRHTPEGSAAHRRPSAPRRWSALIALALAASLSLCPTAAEAHDLGHDSVDCTVPWDCEIRWEDYTRFDTARRYGVAQWNRLGRVDIVPDNAATITDLEFIDYRKCDVTWDAFWTPRPAADRIGFNPCLITSHRFPDPPDPRAVAVHEIGHGLRLAHPSGHTPSPYWEARSIMYGCPRCGPTSTYHTHDVRDYRAMW